MPLSPPLPGLYEHYKGNRYQVLGFVTHTETSEQLVLYRALYGDYGLFVRPVELFNESVIVNGESRLRFEPVEEIK